MAQVRDLDQALAQALALALGQDRALALAQVLELARDLGVAERAAVEDLAQLGRGLARILRLAWDSDNRQGL